MKIYIDSREKEYKHITDYFDEIGQPYEVRHLESADYSSDEPNGVLIERKRSILEIAGNIGAERERFKSEFKRAKRNGEKVIVVIEESYRATAKKMVERAFIKLSTWVAPQDKGLVDDLRLRCLKEVKECEELRLLNFWSDRKCKIQGDTLYKHCLNYIDWYGVEFIFCKPAHTGRIILEKLGEKRNDTQ